MTVTTAPAGGAPAVGTGSAGTPDSAAFLARVRDFVDTEVIPHAQEWDETERLPRSVLDRVAELGLWAPFLPVGQGGSQHGVGHRVRRRLGGVSPRLT